MTIATVKLWGKEIGTLSGDSGPVTFTYEPGFAAAEVEPAPFKMQVRPGLSYSFADLPEASFHGLPGMFADCLPDKFGNRVIDRWLQSQGRGNLNAVERLCYTGSRGMGALEFEPSSGPSNASVTLDIDALLELANSILSNRKELPASLQDPEAMSQIVQVGTLAGGARAKAVVAWNREKQEVRSGQLEHGAGFEHWLIKFDGVDENGDREGSDPLGYGEIEYAYHLMAKSAGIEMMPCELLRQSGHAHFLTKRFDRTDDGEKLHLQSLAALRHLDFKEAGADSYELAMFTISELRLPMHDRKQQFARAVFNVLARNQDDHVKNIAFLMDQDGQWSLSPAYDVTFAFNPDGLWTKRHQMSINGKLDGFNKDDLLALALAGNIPSRIAESILQQVRAAVHDWPKFAELAGINEARMSAIQRAHRTQLVAPR